MDSSNSLFSSSTGNGSSGFGSSTKDGIDLAHYLRLILSNKWKILAFTFLIVAIVFIQVKPMRAIYESSGTILVDTGRAQAFSEGAFGDAGSRDYLNTQYGLLNSRAFVEKVVDRLNLTKHPEYDPRQYVANPSLFGQWASKFVGLFVEPVDEEPVYDEWFETVLRRDVVSSVRNSIQIEPVRGTQLVVILAQTNDPQLSADIVNELGEVYIESYLDANLEAAKQSAEWLSGRLGELQGNLQAAEGELVAYREAENLVDVEGITTLDAAELSQLRVDYVSARQDRIAAEGVARETSRASEFSPKQLLSVLEIANNPAIQQLQIESDAADKNLSDLSRTYGARHPLMVAARDDKEKSDQRLIARLRTVAKSITDNYQRALATERELARQVDQAQNRLQNLGRKEVKLRELERKVEINRQVYEVMLSSGIEADQSVSFEDAPARVIDSALPPKFSVGPNKKKFVLAGAAFAVGLSLMIIILLDLLDSTIRTPEDVESSLKVSMLGFLPLLKDRKTKNALRAFSDDKHNKGFGESIRTIRTSLVLSSLENPFKTILITSSVPNEGKSSVVVNLAEALGQMEKVLVIDADLRKPTIAKTIGLPSSTVGLSNIIMGKAKLEQSIVPFKDANFDVITSGSIPDQPLELLSSSRFKDIIEALKERYDRIIIDAPPAYVVSDAQVLSKVSDSLIYVVKSNSTARSIALKGINSLKKINAPITGVILNHVDLKKAKAYEPMYGAYEEYGYSYKEKKA